eukprot:4060472-Alexandrium_andersonii.AAC.1
MSASLVGSEMCIRDSTPSRASGIPRLVSLPEWSQPAAYSAYCVLRVEPVSYTHLTLPTICSV